MALPLQGNRFDWPNPFHASSVDVDLLDGARAHVLSNHMVLDVDELNKVMRRDYKLITIVRHPLQRFYSMFYYEQFETIYKLNDTPQPAHHFIRNIYKYHHRVKAPKSEAQFSAKEDLLRNGMAFDFNFDGFLTTKSVDTNTTIYNRKYYDKQIGNFVRHLDAKFDLVLVTELFDEGLVLLRRR